MRRSIPALACGLVLALQVGCSSGMPANMASASDAIGQLTRAIPGMSNLQAAVGAGSLLSLAQANMDAGVFNDIAEGVPGSTALMNRARDHGLPDASELTNLASLTSMLDDAGISAAQQEALPSAVGALVTDYTNEALGNAFMDAIR